MFEEEIQATCKHEKVLALQETKEYAFKWKEGTIFRIVFQVL